MAALDAHDEIVAATFGAERWLRRTVVAGCLVGLLGSRGLVDRSGAVDRGSVVQRGRVLGRRRLRAAFASPVAK